MIKKLCLALVVAALAAFGLAACGSSSDDSTSADTTASSTTPATGGGGSSGGAASTVDISADPSGQLAFQEKSVTAKAGDVTVDFTNDSSTTHDVCVEAEGDDDLGCTDQISGSTASTDLGDLKPGSYTFYCSVDSHRDAGMEGTLTVK